MQPQTVTYSSAWWRSHYEGRPVDLEVKVCEEIKKPGMHRHAVSWYCSSWSWFQTSQDLTFGFDVTRGECALELDGAWGGNQSFEILKCGVITEVVPAGGSEDEKVYFHKTDLRIASDCIDFDLSGWISGWVGDGGSIPPGRFWSFGWISRGGGWGVGGGGGYPRIPLDFRVFPMNQFPCLCLHWILLMLQQQEKPLEKTNPVSA